MNNVKEFKPNDLNISFTEQAVLELEKIYSHNKKPFILNVKKSGCSGFSYHFFQKNDKNKFELEQVNHNGKFEFFINKEFKHILNNITVDRIENKIKKEFIFINPNIGDTCGCGESFFYGK